MIKITPIQRKNLKEKIKNRKNLIQVKKIIILSVLMRKKMIKMFKKMSKRKKLEEVDLNKIKIVWKLKNKMMNDLKNI